MDGLEAIKLKWVMLEGQQAQAKEEWVIEKEAVEIPSIALQSCIDKREVKGSIRMELRIREVDKGGDSLINKGGDSEVDKSGRVDEYARGGPLRRVRQAYRQQTQEPELKVSLINIVLIQFECE